MTEWLLDIARMGQLSGASYPYLVLPKNAARRIVINQACTAAVLGSCLHATFGRIGSVVCGYRQPG